jgi:aspartyl protease family protein
MLKTVLSMIVPIVAGAFFFGQNVIAFLGRVEPSGAGARVARPAAAPDTRGCRRGEELILAADRQGHFQVSVEIGGRFAPMMVDTGATRVILPHEEAVRMGLPLDQAAKASVSTANGVVSALVTRADRMRFGPICLNNVDVLVMPPGRLAVGLLGMSAIGSLARFELSRTRLVMAH